MQRRVAPPLLAADGAALLPLRRGRRTAAVVEVAAVGVAVVAASMSVATIAAAGMAPHLLAAFPSPAAAADGGIPAAAPFHRACDLQCWGTPSGNGGGGGGTHGAPGAVPPGVCSASLSATVATPGGGGNGGESSDGDGTAARHRYLPTIAAELSLAWRVRALARASGGAVGRQMSTDSRVAPVTVDHRGWACGAEKVEGIHHGGTFAEFLTLQRNSVHGEVVRYRGNYDVLAVSRVTVGICGTAKCKDVSAVDTTGPATCVKRCAGRDCPCDGAMILTIASQGEGDPPVASVSMEQRGLLSLGRAVLSRTDWLVGSGGSGGGGSGDGTAAAASPFALTAFVRMITESVNDDAVDWDGVTHLLRARPTTYTTRAGGGRPPARPPPATYRNMSWTLDGVPGTGGLLQHSATLPGSVHTSWLAAIASVVCLAPAGRFVDHPHMCDGVPVSADPYTAAPSSRLTALPLSVWPGRTQLQRANNVLWSIFNDVEGAPPAADNTTYVPHYNDSTGLPRSSLSPSAGGWAGALYGPREVRSAAPAEAALAAALRSRRVLLPTMGAGDHTLPEVRGRLLTDRLRTEAAASLQAASVAYDARLFGVPPPAPPADASSVLLAALVVLSEAAALLSGRLAVVHRSARQVASLTIVWAAGCLSTSAVVWLAVEEVRGNGWRAAARRDALGVRWAATVADAPVADAKQFLAGTELARLEAFVMVARHGYRPQLLIGLASAAVSAYALASVVILGSLTRCWMGRGGGRWGLGWWSFRGGGRGGAVVVPPSMAAREEWWADPPAFDDDEDPFRQPPSPAELYRRPAAAVGGGGGRG